MGSAPCGDRSHQDSHQSLSEEDPSLGVGFFGLNSGCFSINHLIISGPAGGFSEVEPLSGFGTGLGSGFGFTCGVPGA